MHQEDHVVCPRIGIAQFSQLLVDPGFLCFEMLDDLEIELNLASGQFTELLLIPPGLILISQQLAIRRIKIEALDDAVQAILGHGDLFSQTPAERDQ